MQQLKQFIDQHQLSQEAFADQVGVTQGVVSMWLRGKKRPSLDNLISIARVTSIPIEKLVADLQKQVA